MGKNLRNLILFSDKNFFKQRPGFTEKHAEGKKYGAVHIFRVYVNDCGFDQAADSKYKRSGGDHAGHGVTSAGIIFHSVWAQQLKSV